MRTGSISKTPKLSIHKKKNFFVGTVQPKENDHKKYTPNDEIIEEDYSVNGDEITKLSFYNFSQ